MVVRRIKSENQKYAWNLNFLDTGEEWDKMQW